MDSKISIAFVVLGFCALGAKAAIDLGLLTENIEDCKTKYNLDEDDMEEVVNAEYNNDKTKCFLTCLGDKYGYIQKFEFNEKGAVKAIDTFMSDKTDNEKKQAQLVVADCAKEFKTNPINDCNLGPAAVNCFAKGAMERGILTKEHIAQMKSISSMA